MAKESYSVSLGFPALREVLRAEQPGGQTTRELRLLGEFADTERSFLKRECQRGLVLTEKGKILATGPLDMSGEGSFGAFLRGNAEIREALAADEAGYVVVPQRRVTDWSHLQPANHVPQENIIVLGPGFIDKLQVEVSEGIRIIGGDGLPLDEDVIAAFSAKLMENYDRRGRRPTLDLSAVVVQLLCHVIQQREKMISEGYPLL